MLFEKIKGITIVFSICAIFAVAASQVQYFSTERVYKKNIDFIIDAGHGIPDGGAVGIDGTTEQELNLKIALKLSKRLNGLKLNTVLTRTDENSIFEEGDSVHAKKISDIRKRIEIANLNKTVPFISIHMNTYPSSNVKGIQVFYKSQNQEAKLLAEKLQQVLNESLQSNHPRVIKTIPNNVYLFSHIENPAILIECGFISNSEELTLLKSDDYQEEMASIIAEILAQG